jgi:hypothetical protein
MAETMKILQAYGAWTVLNADPGGRRVWVACRCGTVRQVALEALQSGDSQSCGCANLASTRPAPRHVSFADEISLAKSRGGRRRHRGGGRES